MSAAAKRFTGAAIGSRHAKQVSWQPSVWPPWRWGDGPRRPSSRRGTSWSPPAPPMRRGRVYDSNAPLLADAVRELGGEPVSLGIVADDRAALTAVVGRALEADVVLLSGGTSKGEGDLSYRVVGELGKPGIV